MCFKESEMEKQGTDHLILIWGGGGGGAGGRVRVGEAGKVARRTKNSQDQVKQENIARVASGKK